MADARSLSRGGQSYVAFATNDYLGLAHHPDVIAAAQAGAAGGAGAKSSRIVVDGAGYPALEAALAGLEGTEAALVFGSGYLANLGVIPALIGPGDAVFIDAHAHACLFAGASLSRAPMHVFAHDDTDALKALLDRHRAAVKHAIILTEGVFSMDGDAASLPTLAALAEAYDAWLLVDDAHGTGVVGPGGGGSAWAAGLGPAQVPLRIGTLSKALGAYGGFLASSGAVVDFLLGRARTLIFHTALPPAVVAAAEAALLVLAREPERAAVARGHARRIAGALGLPAPAAAIVPVLLGANERAMSVQARLLERGVFVPAIRPPTVPEGTARLRISVSAAHRDEDVDLLLEALAEVLG